MNRDMRPRATLISMTESPLKTMAAAAEMYKGKAVRRAADITDQQAAEWFRDVTKTRLQAPFEFIQFHFLLEDVSRAFTHQLVRQRTAVYVQESQRFFGPDSHMDVMEPPSITSARANEFATADYVWDEALRDMHMHYQRLIDLGVPAEDARGILPTNILTKIHYSTDLRALLGHAGNRLCTQAQEEWRWVWAAMIKAIRTWDPFGWECDAIADLFKPICFQTGKCEFMASVDRPCAIRDRVNAHAAKGEHPSEWDDIDRSEWAENER